MGGPEELRECPFVWECPFVRHCHCPFLFLHFEFLGRGQRRACPRRLAPCARGSLPDAARGSASPGCRLTPTPARAPIYSIRQHTSAYVSIRQHAAGGWRACCGCLLTETAGQAPLPPQLPRRGPTAQASYCRFKSMRYCRFKSMRLDMCYIASTHI